MRSSLGSLWLIWVPFLFVLGCNTNQAMEALPAELSLSSMAIEVTPSAAGSLEAIPAPSAKASAFLKERIQTNLRAEGVAPVRLKVQGEGTWVDQNGTLSFRGPTPVIQPSNGKLAAELRARLEKAELPSTMPLGPVAMLNRAVPEHKASFPLLVDKTIKDVTLEGSWVCVRSEGTSPAGIRAVVLDCSIQNGRAAQNLGQEHGRKKTEGVFLGTLKVIRLISKDKTLRAQELQMKLLLGVETPNELRLSTDYRSLWCMDERACPKTSW